MRRWVVVAMIVSLAGAGAGWAQPAPAPATHSEFEPQAGIKPRAVPEAPPYDPKGKRDPFRPFILDLHAQQPREPGTPLQRYDIGELTLVAVLWEVSPPRAMVQDSSGMGYIITVGTLIGRRDGVVKAIEPNRVVVEERVLDYYGQEQTADTVMELPSDRGTKQRGRERQ
jgi:type IV pilus assembly protein PilP